jgi:hypothetical protein
MFIDDAFIMLLPHVREALVALCIELEDTGAGSSFFTLIFK